MRILLDECVPGRVAKLLPGHAVWTVRGMGWDGFRNGALLRRAVGEFDVLVTVDRGIHVDHPTPHGIAVVTMRATSNRYRDLAPLGDELFRTVERAEAGRHYFVGG